MADARYDGLDAESLRARLGVPRLELLATTASTQDVAHRLAEAGAPAGTLVLADEQTAGRGRGGRAWASPAGRGLWLTLIERPRDVEALGVLSIRLGLRAADALDDFAASPVRLKWPNDLYVGAGKLAGILVEARWREGVPDWVAIGFGLNVVAPDVAGAAGLARGVRRSEALAALVPALREAAAARGALGEADLLDYEGRDVARERRCSAPVAGVVAGLDATGALLVRRDDGAVERVRGGSLVLDAMEVAR